MATAVLSRRDGAHLVAGLVHAHTTVSDGALAPDELVDAAHRRGLGVVCITDHHDDDWRHRLGPRLRRPSVVRFGTADYLQAIAGASARSAGPIVLGGLEIQPHYRWEGPFPFLRCEAMKTVVAYGIDHATIDGLPVLLDGRGRDEPEALRTAQAVIDAIRGAGGLSYWSNLEHDERARFGPAALRFRPRPQLLAIVTGYTGFGCFPSCQQACRPGGAWDAHLARAAREGTFDGPWVLGEADFHSAGVCVGDRSISNPTTVLRLERLTSAAVLDALRTGRMYAYSGSTFERSLLERFQVSMSDAAVESGSVLRTDDAPELIVELTGLDAGCSVRVICAGGVRHETRGRKVRCRLPAPAGGAYAVRIEARSDTDWIMSNPIFVAPRVG